MNLRIREGDVVRLESERGRFWYYCRVDRLLDGGELACRVVEAQSWPDLVLEGIIPGVELRRLATSVLSVVREARAAG